MKKQLLFTFAFGLAFGVIAQNSINPVQKIKPELASRRLPINKIMSDKYDPSFASLANNVNQHPAAPYSRAYTSTIIGNTNYDMQSNASVCNRVVLNSDGTICATWTMSLSGSALPSNDRGTGYNYFDGTNWGAIPTTRIENVRVGWPNVGIMGNGKEIVVTHEATSGAGDIHVATRPVKGTGAWTETTLGYPDVWPRMVIGGANHQSIHVISQTTGASGSSNPPYFGQDGAIAYSRSTDGGATWDKIRTVIPQIDSASYLGFGGDNYAIDAKGDTIAIVAGGNKVDVVLIKSFDNGNTWTKTVIYHFPISKYNSATMLTDVDNDGNADTIETNDDNLSVLLDNQGKAHVWYGRMKVFCDAPGTGTGQGLSYFPFTDGLMYWNETMTSPHELASALDINSDGTLNVTAIGTYYNSLTSMPSSGIDAQGRIYVSYSSIYEGIADDGTVGGTGGGKSYRHTYILRTSDGGVNWCGPLDISDPTQGEYVEAVYGALAKHLDNNVHLVFQRDASVGHGLSGSPQGSTDAQSGASDMVYVKVPGTDFDALPCFPLVGIHENELAKNSFSLFPNPANSRINLNFNVTKNSKVYVKIYNALGQQVGSFDNQVTTNGAVLAVNIANYKAGIYFVNAVIEGKTYSQKLIVE